jgi:hypothetical protein
MSKSNTCFRSLPGKRVRAVTHNGVALNDDRNQGVLELLRSQRLTAAMVAARLIRAHRGEPPADLAAQVARIMSHPSGADTPASQPLNAVADPLFGLGTHPDLIERLWTFNASLPEDCRWVVFGFPAPVTPASGVNLRLCARHARLCLALDRGMQRRGRYSKRQNAERGFAEFQTRR